MTTLRFRFAKYGAMKYLGHLDLLRYFQKAVRRAGIPVAYSTGFSPHQIMSFAMPLSVGLTSEGEYFDVGLAGSSLLSAEAYKKNLTETMVDGVEVLSAGYLPKGGKKAMAQVAAAGYIIYYKSLLPDKRPEEIAGIFQNAASIPVTKKTKRGERELDLKQLVYRFETGVFSDSFFEAHPCLDRNPDFAMEDGNPYFYALVNASSGDNVRPEFLMKALTGTDFEADGYLNLGIHRTDLYTGNAKDGFVSLSEGELETAPALLEQT